MEWIAEYAAAIVSNEARAVTKSKKLQTMGQTIDSKVVKGFDFDAIFAMLEEQSFAPFSMRLLEAFTTSRHVEKHTPNRKQRTKMVGLVIIAKLYSSISTGNNVCSLDLSWRV